MRTGRFHKTGAIPYGNHIAPTDCVIRVQGDRGIWMDLSLERTRITAWANVCVNYSLRLQHAAHQRLRLGTPLSTPFTKQTEQARPKQHQCAWLRRRRRAEGDCSVESGTEEAVRARARGRACSHGEGNSVAC